jgi:hypothetical protein
LFLLIVTVAEQQNGEGRYELLRMYEDPIDKTHQVDHKFIDLKRWIMVDISARNDGGNEANLQGPRAPSGWIKCSFLMQKKVREERPGQLQFHSFRVRGAVQSGKMPKVKRRMKTLK